jgi:uncharacterized protein (DUF486 family)
VPANRLGYTAGWSAWQLKILQEVITLVVFAGFSLWWLGEAPRWNHLVACTLVVGAVVMAFWPSGS